MMKRKTFKTKIARRFPFLFFFLSLAVLHPQQIQHETGTINVEVPVRVMDKKAFVDNLTLEDFELYEDGVLQKIESVHMVKKNAVQRTEGGGSFQPKLARCFVMLFEMVDYMPEIDRALDLFFEEIVGLDDELIIITPLKTYNLIGEALEKKSPEELKVELRTKLRRDIVMGNREYVGIIREMESYIGGDPSPEALDRYLADLNRLEQLRYIDEQKLIAFSRFLKERKGQKHVFLFYQKERIPKINPKRLMELVDYNNETLAEVFRLTEMFDFFTRDVSFDVAAVREAFSDSSVAVHFMFVTKTPAQIMSIENESPSGIVLAEQSEDIFSAFSEISAATGGISDSSANPAASFELAAEASENYYLLYYQPKDYKADGGFRRIEVKVKAGKYTVSHRAGYIAD